MRIAALARVVRKFAKKTDQILVEICHMDDAI
jgi:hypothetical protein